MLTSISAMGIDYNGTSNGQSFAVQAGYTVAYVSSSTIKVHMSFTSSSGSGTSSFEQLTAWVLKNGSITAVLSQSGGSSYNLTGTQGQSIVIGVFAPYIVEAEGGQSLSDYTSVVGATKTGTSQVTLGPTTMTVTNFSFAGTSHIMTACSTDDLQSFSVSYGTVPGTSFKLITSLSESGSFTSNGQTTNSSVNLQVITVTAA
jgi:hypothetical protein